jgi:hypothetical protein
MSDAGESMKLTRLAGLIRGWLAMKRPSIVEHAAEGMTFMVQRGPAIADLLERQAARIAKLESALRGALESLTHEYVTAGWTETEIGQDEDVRAARAALEAT